MPKEYCQLCCFHCLCSYRVVYLLVGGLAVWGLVGAALSPATRDPRNQADVAKRQPANPLQEVMGGGWGGGGGGGVWKRTMGAWLKVRVVARAAAGRWCSMVGPVSRGPSCMPHREPGISCLHTATLFLLMPPQPRRFLAQNEVLIGRVAMLGE